MKEKRVYRRTGTPKIIEDTIPRVFVWIQSVAKPILDPPKAIIALDEEYCWRGHLAHGPKSMEYMWPKKVWEAVASEIYEPRKPAICSCKKFSEFFRSKDPTQHSEHCMWHPQNFANTGIK